MAKRSGWKRLRRFYDQHSRRGWPNVVWNIVWANQRRRRGWSTRDGWSMDVHLARIIAEYCRFLRDHEHSYPSQLASLTEWKDILDEMIVGFEMHANQFEEDETHDAAKVERALALFAEHFYSLWW